MRRTALIVAILAVFACGLGSIQAEAAATSPGQAAAGPPPLGQHCVKVTSKHNHWPGTICVFVTRPSGKKPAGEVTFTAHSGTLSVISIKTMRVTMGGADVVPPVNNVSRPATGMTSDAISRSWWDEPKTRVQVSVKNACMTWKGGDKACTGSGWLSSQPVAATAHAAG